jgi:hypothetical protein
VYEVEAYMEGCVCPSACYNFKVEQILMKFGIGVYTEIAKHI